MKVGYKSQLDTKNIEEELDQEIISFDEKTKYLVWHIEGGLGKNIAATALLKSINETYPDRKIVIVASYPEVFINNPSVYRIYRVGMVQYFYDDYIKDKDTLIFRHEPYFQTQHILKQKHLIENQMDLIFL